MKSKVKAVTDKMIELFEPLLRKILSDYTQIILTRGLLSKEYKKQKEIYKNLTRYN